MNFTTNQPIYNDAAFMMSLKIDGRWYGSRWVGLKVKGAEEKKGADEKE